VLHQATFARGPPPALPGRLPFRVSALIEEVASMLTVVSIVG
jgi:hypothetical protein